MQKIIITADDYGMCDAVDKAIDAGIENGMITTTNVMLNMDSLDSARTLRSRYPHVSVGIHWNVTTGRPVLPASEVPSLVDENGVFWSIAVFKKRFSKGLIAIDELTSELEAQCARFEEACGKPDYWNTHENSALHLKSFRIFAAVAQKHGVTATRTFQRGPYYDKVNLSFKQNLREFLVKHFFHLWFSRIRKSFTMPLARVVSFDKYSKLEGDYLLDALCRDGRDYIEVVVHPSITAEHEYFGNISQQRVEEYRLVSSPEIKQKYVDRGIEFVSFSEL